MKGKLPRAREKAEGTIVGARMLALAVPKSEADSAALNDAYDLDMETDETEREKNAWSPLRLPEPTTPGPCGFLKDCTVRY